MKSKSTKPELPSCFECSDGQMHAVVENYKTTAPVIGQVTVPNVPLERCNHCDCYVIGNLGGEIIDAFLDQVMESITPQEIQAFLDKYSLNQKEAAAITGYGEKMFSRWLRGHMRPSKSVSINLRTLLASPEAFEIAKNKNWGNSKAPKLVIEDRQPDEMEKKILSLVDYKALVKMGLVKESQSPKLRRTEICQLFQQETLQKVQKVTKNSWEKMAAFQDTRQASNSMSAGMWCWIGEQAASNISVEPYDRDKLGDAVTTIREYTKHDIEKIIPDVQEILRKAGVALVFVPIMKESGLRGCTKLMSPAKAVIVHGLKYRNHAQFWRILFHEIAHLMLHISEAGTFIADYEDQENNKEEQEADQWADDTLVYSDKLTRFAVRHPKPEHWEIEKFANELKTHPAIVAEIFNKRANKEVIKYSLLRLKNLYPSIPQSAINKLALKTKDHITSFNRLNP